MPNAATHDTVTLLLAPAAGVGAYFVSSSVATALIATATFLFGGLMFGPDLDTPSRQYSRWAVFRFLWFPYRKFFRHRSRFSHGLILGAFLRVVYFLGVVTLVALAASMIVSSVAGTRLPEISTVADTWRSAGAFARSQLGYINIAATFLGLWAGAASHTFTDMAGSYVKTGHVIDYL